MIRGLVIAAADGVALTFAAPASALDTAKVDAAGAPSTGWEHSSVAGKKIYYVAPVYKVKVRRPVYVAPVYVAPVYKVKRKVYYYY